LISFVDRFIGNRLSTYLHIGEILTSGKADFSVRMKKYLFIFYIIQEWESCNRRSLILEMAKRVPHADFVCVNRPADLFVSPLKRRNRLSDAMSKKKRYQKLTNNVYVIRPFFLLHEQIAGKLINQLNGYFLRKQLEHNSIAINQYDSVIQWIYLPSFYHVLRRVNNSSNIIYEVFDEISLTPWDTVHGKIVDDEQLVMAKSDLIFTLTEYIAQKRQMYLDKIKVIGNGVDYELFSKALTVEERPCDIRNLPHPIIGLIGNIRNWIDFRLLKDVCHAKPDWSFLIIGSVEPDAKQKLDAISETNLYILGKKPYEDLYKYYAFVDVGIIPYLQSEFIKASRPLKLLEFLAAGIPVVTVPVDYGNLTEKEGAIYIAKNSSEFVEKIERALSKRDQPACQSIAIRNTWCEVALKALDTCKLKWGIDYAS